MKVKELKRLLSYFSDDIDVVVEDYSTDSFIQIESVRGTAEEGSGTFTVKIDVNRK